MELIGPGINRLFQALLGFRAQLILRGSDLDQKGVGVFLERLPKLGKGWTVGRAEQMVPILVAKGNLALQNYPFIQNNFLYWDYFGLCGTPFHGTLD